MDHDVKGRILVVDDQPNVCVVLSDVLGMKGYQVLTARSYEEAVPFLEGEELDAILTDLKMPGRSGMDLLTLSRRRRPEIPVIMITGHGSVQAAVEAMRRGAFDFITKPVNETELTASIGRALGEARHNARIPSDFFQPDDSFRPEFIGTSQAIEEVFRVVRKVGPTESTVLITGETGVGKELVARAIHLASPRRKGPFLKVHCAAVPTDLVESELFGYEKGAFTGAVSHKPGRFELADGGTLFLDEIGEVPPTTQVKLLTFLQDRAFERVGGIRTVKTDLRILAATNRDLEEMVTEGSFRSDLYYRLNVVPIHIPPLRERIEDISLQADHFLTRFSAGHGKRVAELPPEVTASFLAYHWPGNTRELENVVERLVLMSEDGTVNWAELPFGMKGSTPERREGLRGRAGQVMRTAEREMIAEALEKAGGNRTRAAGLLGISRRTLYKKMKDYGF